MCGKQEDEMEKAVHSIRSIAKQARALTPAVQLEEKMVSRSSEPQNMHKTDPHVCTGSG